MSDTKKEKEDIVLTIILGALAILALKSIFQNDNSKIVSKKGKKMLLDEDKMLNLDTKIKELEKKHYNEIYL